MRKKVIGSLLALLEYHRDFFKSLAPNFVQGEDWYIPELSQCALYPQKRQEEKEPSNITGMIDEATDNVFNNPSVAQTLGI